MTDGKNIRNTKKKWGTMNPEEIEKFLKDINVPIPLSLDDYVKKSLDDDYMLKKTLKEYIKKEEDIWRIPDKSSNLPKIPKKSIKEPQKSREQILQSLDSVFIDDDLKDDIITRVAIPDLLEGKEPAYTGVILFGPPGTGKTILLEAIKDVYQESGAYAKKLSVSSIGSPYIQQFAKNLEEQIQIALEEAQGRGKPSFLYFDEGTILAQNAAEGATHSSKHYQEAIDVLKRYVGNEKNLVIAISTNLLSESFEEALTREGRLTTFFIGYPDLEQRKRMWKHFTGEKTMTLTDEQAYKLAEITPEEQGAFIEQFARNYRKAKRTEILKKKGYNTLVDALKHDANVTEDETTKVITFESLYTDLEAELKAKYDRLRKSKEENGHKTAGFKP